MSFYKSGLFVVLACAGCASAAEQTPAFVAASTALAVADDVPLPAPGSALDDYVDYALRHRPELRASLERWRAASARVNAVDTLPPLEIAYGYYAQRVETRVGPQRHRVRVQQGLGWPGKTRRAEDARRFDAEVDGERHNGELVEIRWQVVDTYWRLWAIEQRHHWQREHEAIVAALADSVRGRIEVGTASLADVGQTELLMSRISDAASQSAQAREIAMLDFARAVGGGTGVTVELDDHVPQPRLPAESDDDLVTVAMAHPLIRVWQSRQRATEAEARSTRMARYPDVGIGVEWMETGPALDPSMEGSGRDAVVGTVALKLPIWDGEVKAKEDALAAQSASFAANEDAARRDTETAVRKALADIRDSARRARLYEGTLVPQAEAVLGSVRGAYEVGQSGVAALILAQNELLQVRLQLAALQGEHERQWAMLERLVGRPVASQEVP